MILEVDLNSPVPPYEQIRVQVVALVRVGRLKAGAKLPPIRQLAGDLGLAPGTVQRAYRELESDGVVATRGRHGTVVLTPDPANDMAHTERLDKAASRLAATADELGATVEDALAAVRLAFASRIARRDA